VVRQVVTKRDRIGKGEIAKGHHDVVRVEVRQSGRVELCIEEINGNHIGFSLDLRLQLGGQTRIGINDEHLELTLCRGRGGRCSWRWSRRAAAAYCPYEPEYLVRIVRDFTKADRLALPGDAIPSIGITRLLPGGGIV